MVSIGFRLDYGASKVLLMDRSHLKKRILVKYRGGTKLQPTGILRYFEELKRGTNKEIGPKDFFEIASNEGAWHEHTES